MSKARQLTDYRKEQLKRLVLDCIMMCYSIDDTINYVQKHSIRQDLHSICI
jgi:hypothetical protein